MVLKKRLKLEKVKCYRKALMHNEIYLKHTPVTPALNICISEWISRLSFRRNQDGVSLISGTQQNTTITFTAQPGPNVPAPSPCRQAESLPPHHRSPSPIMSPPDSGLSCASSLPTSVTSPTMTDVFGLPTPPLSLGTGRSRSPSPLTLIQAASNKPFATKPVLMWSKQDVADWLESLNLGEHRDAFMDNDIEGSHLPNLQKEDLIDLGVTRVGHRMNIERALKVVLDRWDWARHPSRDSALLVHKLCFPLPLFWLNNFETLLSYHAFRWIVGTLTSWRNSSVRISAQAQAVPYVSVPRAPAPERTLKPTHCMESTNTSWLSFGFSGLWPPLNALKPAELGIHFLSLLRQFYREYFFRKKGNLCLCISCLWNLLLFLLHLWPGGTRISETWMAGVPMSLGSRNGSLETKVNTPYVRTNVTVASSRSLHHL